MITDDQAQTNAALLTMILLGFSYGQNEYQLFDITTALAKVLGVPEMNEPTIVEAIHDVAAAIRELAEVMAAAGTTIPYDSPPGLFRRRSERTLVSDGWRDNPC